MTYFEQVRKEFISQGYSYDLAEIKAAETLKSEEMEMKRLERNERRAAVSFRRNNGDSSPLVVEEHRMGGRMAFTIVIGTKCYQSLNEVMRVYGLKQSAWEKAKAKGSTVADFLQNQRPIFDEIQKFQEEIQERVKA